MERKKGLRPRTARIAALIFLLWGLLLGVFVAPSFFNSAAEKAGLSPIKLPEFLTKPYRFGLDIQGGTHLVYKADLSNISTPEYANSMEAVRDVIERRVNLFGVAEPVVQVEQSGKEWKLIVELAGVKDIRAAIQLIGETPYLEFKEELGEKERESILEGGDPYFKSTKLTGRFVKKANLDFK